MLLSIPKWPRCTKLRQGGVNSLPNLLFESHRQGVQGCTDAWGGIPLGSAASLRVVYGVYESVIMQR
jgi:hypothetical protein